MSEPTRGAVGSEGMDSNAGFLNLPGGIGGGPSPASDTRQKRQSQFQTEQSTSAPTERANNDDDEREKMETPHLKEVEEIFRQMVVTEKNLGLYPPHSSVVVDSMKKFVDATQSCLELTGPIRLQLSPESITYEDEPVYHEPNKKLSLAFRIHKDGVREFTILPEVAHEELDAFVTCLKDARKVEDEEDDFITLFWEKDCSSIQCTLADDFISSEDLPPVPEHRAVLSRVAVQKFKVPKEEKERLNDALNARRDDEDGDSSFEITEEEALEIRELVQNEGAYFPLFDFVDILLEVMVRNGNSSEFEKSVKMLRTIVAAVIEDRDFSRAAFLITKLSEQSHPGLTDAHLRQLREMVSTLTDKRTLQIVEEFLEESDRLAPSHPVFDLMRAYPRSSVPDFVPWLRFQKHSKAITRVLIELGTGSTGMLAQFLEDPDPLIVRAMIGVLLETEKEAPVKHLARALKHSDEKVRVYAAKTILENGDDSLAPLFLPLLHESSRQMLNLALQYFGKFSCPEAFDHLEALVKSKNFAILDQKRQRLCLTALLKCSFGPAMDLIIGRMLRWPWCLTQAATSKKSAALMALATSDSNAARETIEKFAQRKKGPLVQVARRALKEMEARQSRQEGGNPRTSRNRTRAQRPPAAKKTTPVTPSKREEVENV
ncbi:MAG: hypothetical protein AAF517_03395 [Planctomycetota bacterium]